MYVWNKDRIEIYSTLNVLNKVNKEEVNTLKAKLLDLGMTKHSVIDSNDSLGREIVGLIDTLEDVVKVLEQAKLIVKVDPDKMVKYGDILVIKSLDEEPVTARLLVARVTYDEIMLIDVATGDRWDDTVFSSVYKQEDNIPIEFLEEKYSFKTLLIHKKVDL